MRKTPEDQQRPSVRKMLMMPLMSGMTALLLLIGAGLYAQHVGYYDRQLNANRLSALKLYHSSVRDLHATLGSLLEALAADGRLAVFFETRNAGGIEKLYRAVFERLRTSYHISSLIFIDAQQCVITDLARPERRNAMVNRFIFSEAERSGVTVVGLDVGDSGGLTMRMVAPVIHHRVLIGYIEAAIDFGESMRFMDSDGQEAALIFALNKNAVTEELLPENRAGGDAPGMWLDAGNGTIVYTSVKTLDPLLVRALLVRQQKAGGHAGSTSFSLVFDYAWYAAGVFPLTDSLGSPLGELFIVEESTAMWTEYLISALVLLGLGLAVMLACHRLVARKLVRTDEQIDEMMTKIHEGTEIFENVFKESETGFVLQNWTTGEVLRANRAALALFAVDEAAHIDLSQMRPLEPDDPIQASWRASESASPLMYVNTEKGVAYCELSHFFLGVNEEIQCVAIRDVTRVVTLQSKNQEQIRYLQAIIDQLPGMVSLKDSNYHLIMYNAVFDQVFGEGESMIGKVYFADWLGGIMDEMLVLDNTTFESGLPANLEFSFTLRDGEEHTFLLNQKLIDSNTGDQELLCVATDITERTRMEKQLIVLRRRAEEASLAKSQFLARMSHEIRTPMNVILGMSHLAISAGPDEKQRNYLTKIQGAAKNLLGIINDILDFSKIEAGEMTLETIPFSLNDLLLDVEAGIQALLTDKAVVFRLTLPGVTGELMGDPLRIRQVLLNLVNNAIKFTENGSVHLACHIREEEEHSYTLEFSVTDTGIGIPEEGIQRLFSSFQQVDGSTTRKYGGTGLGLSISQEFVSLMGGEIAVSSTVGKGSVFAFTITLGKAEKTGEERDMPGVAAAWQEHDERRSAGRAASSGGVRELPSSVKVLVVEDNDINQEIIVELLEQRHLRTKAVGNGREALQAVEEEAFDLVLMDLQMPVMDGLEATRAIRALPGQATRTLPIIALTANAMSDDREHCLEAGMNDFLSKPIDVNELDAKLQQWLGAVSQ